MLFLLPLKRNLYLLLKITWPLFFLAEAYADTTLRGRVLDKQNNPLEHVEVFVEATNRGDVTDKNGHFQITNIGEGSYIVRFRLLGYETVKRTLTISKAQDEAELNVVMNSTIIELSDILVTATRNQTATEDLSQFVSVINPRKISERNVHQTPELLREEAGLVVQKTNQGGGSPIMRGLKANKLLLLVDGIRLNNSTYRGGNTQYLNTVDSNTLDRVEVVHGPISVMYGSDALGGAINLITKTPLLHRDDRYRFNGSASGSISTADETRTINVNLMTSNSKWGLLIDGSFKSFGNITRGSNGGSTLMHRLRNDSRTARDLNKEQSPNGYDTFDISAKALIKFSDFQDLTVAYQMNRQNEVPRYDVVETLRDSIRLFDPQERELYYLKYTNKHPTPWFNVFTSTISLHRQFERRIRQRFGSIIETTDQFRTLTAGLQFNFTKLIGDGHQIVYGTELYVDDVATESSSRNTITEEKNEESTLFPDGSSFVTFGAFIQDAVRILQRWTLTPGIRFSATKLKAPFENSPELSSFGNVSQTTSAFTGSLGSQYQLGENFSLVANLAQGFRTPNMDDVSKSGLGKGSSFFDIPNPKAGPEKSISIDGGVKIFSNKIRANIFGFYNRITDLLVRRPAQFNGSSFIIEEGDTLAVFHKENAGSAYTTGFAFNAEIFLSQKLAILSNLSYTYGQNTSDDEPLTGIPPFGGLIGIRWRISRYWAEINSRFATEQTRLALEDQEDLRIPEGGTPGWSTFNLRFGINFSRQFNFKVSINNIFDRNYREHLSGFNAPGRNLVFSAQWRP